MNEGQSRYADEGTLAYVAKLEQQLATCQAENLRLRTIHHGAKTMNIKELKNWLRPSIQQPRYIANMVKAMFAPTIKTQQVIQEYWSTWNKTYHPEKEKDVIK